MLIASRMGYSIRKTVHLYDAHKAHTHSLSHTHMSCTGLIKHAIFAGSDNTARMIKVEGYYSGTHRSCAQHYTMEIHEYAGMDNTVLRNVKHDYYDVRYEILVWYKKTYYPFLKTSEITYLVWPYLHWCANRIGQNCIYIYGM